MLRAVLVILFSFTSIISFYLTYLNDNQAELIAILPLDLSYNYIILLNFAGFVVIHLRLIFNTRHTDYGLTIRKFGIMQLIFYPMLIYLYTSFLILTAVLVFLLIAYFLITSSLLFGAKTDTTFETKLHSWVTYLGMMPILVPVFYLLTLFIYMFSQLTDVFFNSLILNTTFSMPLSLSLFLLICSIKIFPKFKDWLNKTEIDEDEGDYDPLYPNKSRYLKNNRSLSSNQS